MKQKPKRKPKNKNLSIDEQIESLLEDDEYIIWSGRTQKHYGYFAFNGMKMIFAGAVLVIGISLFVDTEILKAGASVLIGSACLCLLGFAVFSMYSNLNIGRIFDYINVITNYHVMVYDPIAQDVVYAFEHDNIHKFRVREYGANIGNITVDRRSGDKARYRVSPKYPLEFTLRGIDDLSTVVNLLRSQLGIEPEYLQIHPKQKS